MNTSNSTKRFFLIPASEKPVAWPYLKVIRSDDGYSSSHDQSRSVNAQLVNERTCTSPRFHQERFDAVFPT